MKISNIDKNKFKIKEQYFDKNKFKIKEQFFDKNNNFSSFKIKQIGSNVHGSNGLYSRNGNCEELLLDVDENGSSSIVRFSKYNLDDEQLLKLSRLCIQEQGTIEGAAAEASLMANRFEIDCAGEYNGKTGANGLYDYVRDSGWWNKSSDYMDNGSTENPATNSVIKAVEDVLINGKRTLPKYVNEHDSIDDLKEIVTNEVVIDDKDAKNNSKNYVSHVSTCIQNNKKIDGGDKWIYYGHPAPGSDPFGYDKPELREKYGDGHYDFDTGEYVDK